MEPSLNSWTIIFLIAACQGLFLGVLIWFNKRIENVSRKLLSIIVLGFSIILLYCVAFWTNYITHMPQWSSLALRLTYLIGPAMLFYVRVGKSKSLPSNFWMHSIPFFVHIALVFLSTLLGTIVFLISLLNIPKLKNTLNPL